MLATDVLFMKTYIVIYLQTYIEHFTFILDILLSSEVHLPG